MITKSISIWKSSHFRENITKCTSVTKLIEIFKVSAQYKLVSVIKYNKNNGIH